MRTRLWLIIISSCLFWQASAQVYDFTMLPTATGGGVPGTAYNQGFGPRNFLPNGSFNWYEAFGTCQGLTWGSVWNIDQDRWQTSSGSTPYSMIAPGTYWPYDLSYHCDYHANNWSSPANNEGFYGGYIQTYLMRHQSGVMSYNYLLFTLKKPLTPGVQFYFSMQMAKQYTSSGNGYPSVDGIGAVLLTDLPDSLPAHGFLSGMQPFVESPADVPVDIDAVTVSDTIIGQGQRYLIIGVFAPVDSLTFDPAPASGNWYANYTFDNFKLYRPGCNGATSGFYSDLVNACGGDTVMITPMYSTGAIHWAVDGIDAGAADTIHVGVPPIAERTVRLVSDTGTCSDTAYMVVRANRVVVDIADTALQCTDPMVLNPTVGYVDLDPGWVSYTWTNLDSSFSQSSYGCHITLADTGTYILHMAYDGCLQTDTFRVDTSRQLLTDADGVPYLMPEVRPEHCVHMNDGAIIVHDLGYPIGRTIAWQAPIAPTAGDTLSALTAGTYEARVWDEDGRCVYWNLDLPLMLDSCTNANGTVVQSFDPSCTTVANDVPLALRSVTATPSGNVGVTDSTGHYTIYLPPGSTTLHHAPTAQWTGNRCGDGTTVDLALPGDTAIVNFTDTVHIPVHDLGITSVYGWAWAIGHQAAMSVYVKNFGELPEQAEMKLLLQPAFDVTTAGDAEYMGSSGDTLFYDLGTLQPQELVNKILSVAIPVNTDLVWTASVMRAEVVAVPGETNLLNNVHTVDQTIFGAYDPNDKSVSPFGDAGTHIVDTTRRQFTYTVQFQNTGNYPATRVLVTDTLHHLLDPSSLHLVHASHPVQAFVYNGVLYLDHEGIMLPDSASDPEGSKGEVIFTLDATPAAAFGDSILNTANIFFDQNPPIITNTVYTVYGSPSTVGIMETQAHVRIVVVPDGSRDMRYAVTGGIPRSIQVIDAQGKTVLRLAPKAEGRFATDGLAPGIYVLQAVTAKEQMAVRFALAR